MKSRSWRLAIFSEEPSVFLAPCMDLINHHHTGRILQLEEDDEVVDELDVDVDVLVQQSAL